MEAEIIYAEGHKHPEVKLGARVTIIRRNLSSFSYLVEFPSGLRLGLLIDRLRILTPLELLAECGE